MPPPPLSRHLRPCHPPWRARPVHPAARRARYSTAGDEGPPRRPKDSWWSAAVASIPSFGFRTAPPPPPARTQSGASDDSAPEAPPPAQKQLDRHVVANKGKRPSPQRQRRPARPPPGTGTGAVQGGDQSAVQASDQGPIQEQLRQLFDQVKRLQDTFAANEENKAKAKTARPASLARTSAAATTSAPPRAAPVTPALQSHVYQFTTAKAKARYRNSISCIIRAASDINTTMPSAGASIIALIENRLAVLAQEAIAHCDIFTLQELRRYKKLSLEDVLRQELSILEFAETIYLHSVLVLVGCARDVERMHTPSLSALASSFRHRLGALAHRAKSENDGSLRYLLKEYYEEDSASKRLGQKSKPTTSTARNTASSLAERDLLATRLNVSSPTSATSFAQQAHTAGVKETRVNTEGVSKTKRVKIRKYDPDPNGEDHKEEGFVFRQIKLQKSGLKEVDVVSVSAAPPASKTYVPHQEPDSSSDHRTEHGKDNSQEIAHQIQTQSRMMISSDHPRASAPVERSDEHAPTPLASVLDTLSDRSAHASEHLPRSADTKRSKPAPSQSEEVNDQSLLNELFPEANPTTPSQPVEKANKYSKLDPPKSTALVRRSLVKERPKTLKEKVVESFQTRGEKITVLQLEHCSTELTEVDFRRLIPRGEHIEGWNRAGEFDKVIPGRDPLSLERLPFYYLLFKSPESAFAYQKNAGRLHKLVALHQPSSIFSAVPVPKGFLEDGEDVDTITKSYLLKPTEHSLNLSTIMQPYHPALRTMIEQGGYKPIVPSVDEKGNRLYKVLLHIEGYEPSHSDLFKILRRDAYLRGTTLNLRNESSSSLHRLRDIINLKTRLLPISTTNPRAFGHFETSDQTHAERAKMKVEYEDPSIAAWMKSDDADEQHPNEVNQTIMNRVYNRWVLEFDDEDEARRFAVQWHRRVLPELLRSDRTWKDYEEVRMCNCEFLW